MNRKRKEEEEEEEEEYRRRSWWRGKFCRKSVKQLALIKRITEGKRGEQGENRFSRGSPDLQLSSNNVRTYSPISNKIFYFILF